MGVVWHVYLEPDASCRSGLIAIWHHMSAFRDFNLQQLLATSKNSACLHVCATPVVATASSIDGGSHWVEVCHSMVR